MLVGESTIAMGQGLVDVPAEEDEEVEEEEEEEGADVV